MHDFDDEEQRNLLAMLLGNQSWSFQLGRDRLDPMHRRLCAAASSFHAERNELFAAICADAGLESAQHVAAAEPDQIPLLAIPMFKDANSHALLTCSIAAVDLEIRSTGTSGIPSVARRDASTVTRCATAIVGSYREFFGVSSGHAMFLCPSVAEYPEMGMLKVFNVLNGLVNSRDFAITEDSYNVDAAIERVRTVRGSTRHLVGPPFAIARFVRRLAERGERLPLDRSSLVLMLGGWKRYTGEEISRSQLCALVEDRLGVEENSVRDMYGFIESSMLAVECEQHVKHVPPWCRISVREEDDPTRPVADGVEGRIAVHDYVNSSYPGFVLSDDIGITQWIDCTCGRSSQTVEFRRRRIGTEIGCCAISLEKWIDSRELVEVCVPTLLEQP